MSDLDFDDAAIERAARALCIADGYDNPDEDWRECRQPGGGYVVLDVALEPGKEQRWRTYVRQVRLVIVALADVP